MLRFGLYARKSKEDKSGAIKSIEDQKAIWAELATQMGIDIASIYEENKTAMIPNVRPIYKELIGEIKAGRLDGILVWHINRLARNMEEAGSLAQMLIDGKIQEIRTPSWTYHSGDNILPLLMEQGMSAQSSRDLSNTIRLSFKFLVDGGGWPHRAKLGYLNQRDPLNSKRGIVVADPQRFGLVRKGVEIMLTGAYSVRQVIDQMNDWGLRTKPSNARPAGKLSYGLGYDLFTNPFYAGFTRHNGVIRKGNHSAMMSVSEFNQLQVIMQRHRRSRRKKREFAYTGLMQCGACGMQVTADYHFKSGKDRIYYHCSDPYGRCTKRGISLEDLEGEIVSYLEGIQIDETLCDIALENIHRWQGEQSQGTGDILAQQEEQLQSIKTQRDNLLNLTLQGYLSDPEAYKRKDVALVAERNRLQLEVAKSREELLHIRSQAKAALDLMRSGLSQFSMAENARKKEIVAAVVGKLELNQKMLCVEVDPALTEMVSFSESIEKRIQASLEPPNGGNSSSNSSYVGLMCRAGWRPEILLEPPSTLIAALQVAHFGPLFSSDLPIH
jgi:site-specific DNA recombinase